MSKAAEQDVFGFFETMVEYYTGRDASLLTDEQLAIKIHHLAKIRKMEGKDSVSEILQNFG